MAGRLTRDICDIRDICHAVSRDICDSSLWAVTNVTRSDP